MEPRIFTAKGKSILRVIRTTVTIAPLYDPSTEPRPIHKSFPGIWDTGATNSVITEKVVYECGLKPTGMAKISHARGGDITETYLINMVLPNGIGLKGLRVTQGILAGDTEVLIGMDAISQGDFAISNFGGQTWFTFRIPSKECIDFGAPVPTPSLTSPLITFPPLPDLDQSREKVGRNAPCPCGSGKKFKKCCGK